MINRLSSGVRVSWQSSTAFATIGTSIVTVVVLPLLSVLFAVLMGADVATPDLTRTGYASVLIAWTASITSGIVGATATDRRLGVYLEVMQYRLFDIAYWLARATMPCLLSFITGATSVAVVFAFSPHHDGRMLFRAAVLAIIAIICGLLTGIAASGIGVSLSDPYLGASLFAAFLPVFAGVIVPLDYCPSWVRAVAVIFPMSGSLDALDGWETSGIIHDLIAAAIWAACGVALTTRAVRNLRRGKRITHI